MDDSAQEKPFVQPLLKPSKTMRVKHLQQPGQLGGQHQELHPKLFQNRFAIFLVSENVHAIIGSICADRYRAFNHLIVGLLFSFSNL